jgi:hypothetical protein
LKRTHVRLESPWLPLYDYPRFSYYNEILEAGYLLRKLVCLAYSLEAESPNSIAPF